MGSFRCTRVTTSPPFCEQCGIRTAPASEPPTPAPVLTCDVVCRARGRRTWISQEGDFLLAQNPTWFKSVVWAELLFQVPMCFVLALGWAFEKEWVWLPSIIYSVHVLTTMIPIELSGPPSA